MNRLLLLTGMSSMVVLAMAQTVPEPKTIENSDAYAISANARYLVSDGYSGMRIYDLETDSDFDYTEGSSYGKCYTATARCVSDNGIVVGYDANEGASYWLDGTWKGLKRTTQARGSYLVNSITSDGKRICGTAGLTAMSYDDDVLRQAPCIWNWDEATGDFGSPILLPHPDKDFSGRIPQLITAIDISDDGKTIVGQVVTAVGMCLYPIIYTENEDGEWSYYLPNEKELYPEGFVFPEYPGDEGPVYPQYEAYMTEAEVEAYNEAYTEYRNSGFTIAEPQYTDYMTPSEIEAYDKAMAEYKVVSVDFEKKFSAWFKAYWQIAYSIPDFEFNSIRISPDGKSYANTVVVSDIDETTEEIISCTYVWVFDMATGNVTKYEQHPNFILTYLANDAIALAATNLVDDPESYVLKDGECIDMQKWISSLVPEYGVWMDDNMVQGIDVLGFNEDTGEEDIMYVEKVITGRACGTPDMSVVALGVNNVWDLIDDGNSYIFNLSAAGSVATPIETQRVKTIYDLQGRKVKSTSAPGIYIIDGKKKAVR